MMLLYVISYLLLEPDPDIDPAEKLVALPITNNKLFEPDYLPTIVIIAGRK